MVKEIRIYKMSPTGNKKRMGKVFRQKVDLGQMLDLPRDV